MLLRHARPEDRDALYTICRLTGADGRDGTELVSHPDLYGDIWAGPYLALEPRLASVLVDAEGVAGYVLGAANTAEFTARMEESWWPAVRAKYADLKALVDSAEALGPDDERAAAPQLAPQDAALLDAIYSPLPELAELAEQYPSHLHIDILPRIQGGGWGAVLVEQLIADLQAAGSPGVHLIASATNLHACSFYRRMGFTSRPTSDEQGVIFTMRLRPKG